MLSDQSRCWSFCCRALVHSSFGCKPCSSDDSAQAYLFRRIFTRGLDRSQACQSRFSVTWNHLFTNTPHTSFRRVIRFDWSKSVGFPLGKQNIFWYAVIFKCLKTRNVYTSCTIFASRIRFKSEYTRLGRKVLHLKRQAREHRISAKLVVVYCSNMQPPGEAV